jgi:hypothetical protein
MRLSRNLVLIGSLLTAVMAGAMTPASDPVGGPALGFSPNAAGSIVWPILGIPGASMLGHRLALESEIRGAVVSPRQDYMIAIRAEDGQPVLRQLISEPYANTPIEGARRGDAVIAISPGGPSAALFYRDSRVLQVLHGLPENPVVAFELDTASLSGSSGQLTAFAVSDDASVALLGFAGAGDSLWAVSATGSNFVTASHASSIAFILNRHDAVVADNLAGEAFLLFGTGAGATRIPLVSAGDGVNGLAGIAVSDDGRFAVVAGAASGNVGIVDLERSTQTVVSCNCRPSGVYRMTGTAVFRLNEPPDGLVTVLDLASGKPRMLVIPPEPKPQDAGAKSSR